MCMLKSNGAFRAVRCTEVVRISEGPLREVPLYRSSEVVKGTNFHELWKTSI